MIGLVWFCKVWLGYVKVCRVRLGMDRLNLSLVWLGLFWLGSFRFISMFEKNGGEISARKNNKGKYLAGNRITGVKT